MTAQISDIVTYKAKKYSLIGFTNQLSFHPSDFEIIIGQVASCCWKGFLQNFLISDKKLVLDRIDIEIQENTLKPRIYGKRHKLRLRFPYMFFNMYPFIFRIPQIFNTTYSNIGYHFKYTGSILIGSDFMQEFYVHMGFAPAWKYEIVHELTFVNGVLANSIDLSEKMKEAREIIEKHEGKRIAYREDSNYTSWIEETFNQKYGQEMM